MLDSGNTLGARIKELRERAGLSQAELSKLLGYSSRSSIYNVENNRNVLPLDKAYALADFFGVSVEYLLGKSVDEYEYDRHIASLDKKVFNLSTYPPDEKERISYMLDEYFNLIKNNDNSLLLIDLREYPAKQRELIKGLITSTLEQFNK